MVPIPSVPLPEATWEYVREQPGQPHSGKWDQESPAVGSWTLRNTEGDEGGANMQVEPKVLARGLGQEGWTGGLPWAGAENRAENLRESREICG